MKVVFHEDQLLHHPRHFLVNGVVRQCPEVPDRAAVLLESAREAGCEQVAPDDADMRPIAAVHTPEYLDYLQHIHERWRRIDGASEEVIANVHPDRRDGGYPRSAVGQAGYHSADTACPIGPETWGAAVASASSAIRGARSLLDGESEVYALCRPPGHHAFKDIAGGFCYLNNTAIAAQLLSSKAARVAIVDVDLHHGNGTQGIFYDRDDVLTVSLHADPVRFYPFFWGYAEERGEGPGLGCNLNIPLPRGSGDDVFLEALRRALGRVRAFAPDFLVVSLGLDAYEGDPLAGLAVTTDGFGRIAETLGDLGLPSLLVQEGGYLCDDLGCNLAAFLRGFAGARRR